MTPRPTTRRRLLPAALLLLLLIPLFVTIPVSWRQDPLISPLGDRYHVVLFFILPLLLHRRGPLAGRPLAALLAAVAMGAATELLQLLAGRSAALWDWYQDVLGVALAGCWLWWRQIAARPRARWRRLAPAAATLAVVGLVLWPLRDLPAAVTAARAAQSRFPLLDDFERPDTLHLWDGHRGGELARVPVAGRGHVLEIRSGGGHRWPGAASSQLPWNWAGHDTLRLACRLVAPSPDSLRASFSLLDRAGVHDTERYRHAFTVTRRWREVAVPVATLGDRAEVRPPALGVVLLVSISLHAPARAPAVLQIDDLRLQPAGR
jgi:VanZ family protein